jgi:hypothetical protein
VTKILTIKYTMKWHEIEEQITWLYEELLYETKKKLELIGMALFSLTKKKGKRTEEY